MCTSTPNTSPKRSIKEMVKDNQQVNFVRYFDGQLWYATSCGFEFPVPVADIGNATFYAQDKALLLMRYMRKHLENIEAGQTN